MGKCLSCFKDDQSNKHSECANGGNETSRRPLFSASYQAATDGNLDTEQNLDLSTRSSQHKYGSSAVAAITVTESSGLPGSPYCADYTDNCSNGAAPKLPTIMGVTGGGSGGASSDKKSFYSRIPPLTRPSSHDTRRHSSKDYFSETKINTLFDIYRDSSGLVIEDGKEEEAMLSDGIQRFCADLDVNVADFKVLLFAWKCEAEMMCRFTRSEFVRGCKSLKVDSIKGIISKFPELQAEAKELEAFKKMYKWAFKFGLDHEAGQRILPADMALLMWKLVFEQRKPLILDRWLAFLESHPSIRGIPRDTWNMFLNFSETVGNDLSSYDDTEAWPSLFDDFVEYENDQLNQNISKEPKQ